MIQAHDTHGEQHAAIRNGHDSEQWKLTYAGVPFAFHRRVTPATASEWFTHYHYAGQRPINKEHVARLVLEMKRNSFGGNTAAFRFLNGHPFLINAYHTLHAIIESELPQVLLVDIQGVNSERDLELEYSRYDRGRVRTLTEAMPMDRLAAELCLTQTDVRAIGVAAPLVLSGFDRGTYRSDRAKWQSAERRLEFIEEWGATGKQFFAAIAFADSPLSKLLRRAAAVAVGMATIKHAGTPAVEFWESAATEDGASRYTPARQVATVLREAPYTGGSHSIEGARLLARCWNAHASGRGELRIVKSLSGTFSILGTPFQIT